MNNAKYNTLSTDESNQINNGNFVNDEQKSKLSCAEKNGDEKEEFMIPDRYSLNGRKKAVFFPLKLMKVLSMKEYKSIIEWLPDGTGFRIVDRDAITEKILPEHFKTAKYSSFTRKLLRWGFQHKKSCYTHPLFQRGRLDLVDQMTCESHNNKAHFNGTIPGLHQQNSEQQQQHQQQQYQAAMHYNNNPYSFSNPYSNLYTGSVGIGGAANSFGTGMFRGENPYLFGVGDGMMPHEQHYLENIQRRYNNLQQQSLMNGPSSFGSAVTAGASQLLAVEDELARVKHLIDQKKTEAASLQPKTNRDDYDGNISSVNATGGGLPSSLASNDDSAPTKPSDNGLEGMSSAKQKEKLKDDVTENGKLPTLSNTDGPSPAMTEASMMAAAALDGMGVHGRGGGFPPVSGSSVPSFADTGHSTTNTCTTAGFLGCENLTPSQSEIELEVRKRIRSRMMEENKDLKGSGRLY